MFEHDRKVSIEQAEIITRIYQENEDQSISRKRALSLKKALETMEISIEPGELIVSNRTSGVRDGVVFPESGCSWVSREAETISRRRQDPFDFNPEDQIRFKNGIEPYWKSCSMEEWIVSQAEDQIKEIEKVVKINQKDHAQGHICPNTKEWLDLGPAGLIEKARKRLLTEEDPNKREFLENVILVLRGAQNFMLRYADRIDQMAENASGEQKTEMAVLAEICRSLSQRKAETFHEALQSLWFLFVILHMESNASSFSPGRLDLILESRYEKDRKEGRIDSKKALELIECLFLKFNEIVYMRNQNSARYFAGFPIGFNIALGGMDENGHAFENELSYLFLQAQEELGLPQPNLSVRLNRNTSSQLMQKAIQVVSKGSGMPQFFNDEAIVKPLEDLGIPEKEARNYSIVGCVELSLHGCALGWSDAAMFNLNKALELTLHHGKDLLTGKPYGPDFGGLDTYETYEELEAAFAKMIDFYIGKMMETEEVIEKAHQKFLPTAFLSSVIDDCIEKGIDVTAGGARYNFSGIQMIQAANLADSLAAIKQLVYDQKIIGRKELMQVLEDNFESDQEKLIQTRLLRQAPKYGNDIEWVDDLASKWADYFSARIRSFTNYRGGPCHTGMYTVSAHVPMGENVGATADGRKAGTPLADGGMSPVYGRDENGPTAVLKSVSRLKNVNTTNGGLLNMKFLPSFFASKKGRDSFEQLLRAFVDLKIPHVQFNVVTPEDLLDAKAHPEKHRSLTVRVAGYTAYFTELDGKLQDEIIARTFYDRI